MRKCKGHTCACSCPASCEGPEDFVARLMMYFVRTPSAMPVCKQAASADNIAASSQLVGSSLQQLSLESVAFICNISCATTPLAANFQAQSIGKALKDFCHHHIARAAGPPPRWTSSCPPSGLLADVGLSTSLVLVTKAQWDYKAASCLQAEYMPALCCHYLAGCTHGKRSRVGERCRDLAERPDHSYARQPHTSAVL